MYRDEEESAKVRLANDDYSIRQFLYPSLTRVPEPGTLALLSVAFAAIGFARLRKLH